MCSEITVPKEGRNWVVEVMCACNPTKGNPEAERKSKPPATVQPAPVLPDRKQHQVPDQSQGCARVPARPAGRRASGPGRFCSRKFPCLPLREQAEPFKALAEKPLGRFQDYLLPQQPLCSRGGVQGGRRGAKVQHVSRGSRAGNCVPSVRRQDLPGQQLSREDWVRSCASQVLPSSERRLGHAQEGCPQTQPGAREQGKCLFFTNSAISSADLTAPHRQGPAGCGGPAPWFALPFRGSLHARSKSESARRGLVHTRLCAHTGVETSSLWRKPKNAGMNPYPRPVKEDLKAALALPFHSSSLTQGPFVTPRQLATPLHWKAHVRDASLEDTRAAVRSRSGLCGRRVEGVVCRPQHSGREAPGPQEQVQV
ncbi:PREDICTED: uncharacterized protein LOC106147631 [Chinchilla lanigera]|uniref:uncharacterized protein LOC106147631 n=1 Tax=Chinchilla lanigera TaxID=34839 RepID=UPI000696A347|nr:PREDICTED: uncharacterized protein LOC106147631 [Chinchilla lanigera]